MTLRDDLDATVLARSPYRRQEVTWPEYEAWAGANLDDYSQVYVGPDSITLATCRRKLVKYTAFPVPAGEAARSYLRRVFATLHPMRPVAYDPNWSWEAPILCRPVRHRALAYVDIAAAYFQIMRVYRPDDLIDSGGQVYEEGVGTWWRPDELMDDRRLRHSIAGSMFSSEIEWYCRGEPRRAFVVKPWSSPDLKGLVMRTLHAVCRWAQRAFTVHAWLTDAAIVDHADGEIMVEALRLAWGIESRVVACGPGAVWSPTSYCVGEKMSMDLSNKTVTPAELVDHPFSNLRRVRGESLRRERLARCAKGNTHTPDPSTGGRTTRSSGPSTPASPAGAPTAPEPSTGRRSS